MADRNGNGNDNPPDDFEEELLEPNFDVNIPFPRNRMPNAHPEPVGRYYLGEWSRAEREFQHARERPHRPPVPPVQEHQVVRPQAERANPPAPAPEVQEVAAQNVGAERPISPAPPLHFEELNEELEDQENVQDPVAGMNNALGEALNNEREERRRHNIFELQQLINMYQQPDNNRSHTT